eukprot:1313680-Alexandrium_andersonii.AAC.1
MSRHPLSGRTFGWGRMADRTTSHSRAHGCACRSNTTEAVGCAQLLAGTRQVRKRPSGSHAD